MIAEQRPLRGYAVLSSVFTVSFSAALAIALKRRGEPPSPTALDLATGGVAVFKLSRIIAKDDVAAFARAPFVSLQETEDGEVTEEATGDELRRAIGELVTCPLCLALWTGGALTVAHVGAPRVARAVSFLLTASAIAEALQLAFSAAETATS